MDQNTPHWTEQLFDSSFEDILRTNQHQDGDARGWDLADHHCGHLASKVLESEQCW